MFKLFVGDVVTLFGKSRHGKNRIRENGDTWRVLTVKDNSICVRPIDLDRRENWRWIDIPDDEHMNVKLVEVEEPEHVRVEREVDLAIERRKDQQQHDMFNDETMNWSGLR